MFIFNTFRGNLINFSKPSQRRQADYFKHIFLYYPCRFHSLGEVTSHSLTYQHESETLVLRYENGETCGETKKRRATVILFTCDKSSDAVSPSVFHSFVLDINLYCLYISNLKQCRSIAKLAKVTKKDYFVLLFACLFCTSNAFLTYSKLSLEQLGTPGGHFVLNDCEDHFIWTSSAACPLVKQPEVVQPETSVGDCRVVNPNTGMHNTAL